METHNEWIESISGSDALTDVAKRAGVPMRTLYSQRDRGRFTAENVIAIALAYDRNPVRALVDTGYLESRWAEQVDPAVALRRVSEDDLADEVLRRMKLGQTKGALGEPVDGLAARRGFIDPMFDHDDGTVRPFRYDASEYAADSSPDEDELREERGESLFD